MGQFGAWSNVHSLKVEWGAVSGLSPADGSTTTDTTPTLNWNAVSGAAGYELQLAESRAGVEASPIQSVTGASYTPASVLTNEQTYYWRVRAVDGDGEYGAWSGIASLWVENVLVSTSIAYWSFDGNTDDTQETGNAKAFNDYSYTNGVKNQAIYLTGSGHSGLNGGHVILPFIDLSRMDEFSISLWVKQDGNTSYLNHSESFITFGATGDGERIEIGYSPESGNVFFQGGIVYPLGVNGVKEWNHYTLVYNNDTVHGYINGKLIDTALYPISTMKEYSGIGCHWWSGGTANSNRFIGAIDEVMIFNYALEKQEIDKLLKLQY